LGTAASWPRRASAQQQKLAVVGYLHPGAPEPNASLLAAFRKGLAEAGYTEGKNVAIEFRCAHGENSRLGEMAADLVQRQVAVIVTPIGTVTALAAKTATTTIPIVFSAGTDPVKAGIVASLRRPGGNVTGVNYMAAELSAKRLSLLHELASSAARIALLVMRSENPSDDTPLRNPITGIAGCCARAASGHAAAPPSSVMNSRRFIRGPRRRGRSPGGTSRRSALAVFMLSTTPT